MYLLAPFIVSMFPEEVLEEVEWFPFPIIDPRLVSTRMHRPIASTFR
jgi:hypothetical protein